MSAPDRWARARAAAARRRAEHVSMLPGEDSGLPMVLALLDGAGYDVAFQAATDPLLRGAWAAVYPDAQLAICDRTLTDERKAFALAHEIGHLDLHVAGGGAMHGDPKAAPACAAAEIVIDAPVDHMLLHAGYPQPNEVYNPRQQRELEANVFALELLAPRALLRRLFVDENLTASAIAGHLRITRAAALNALAWLLQSGMPAPGTNEACAEAMLPVKRPVLDLSQSAAAGARGATLVSAGPGSGKTGTLVGRIDYLVRNGAVDPRRILVLTYSNRAAAELRERVSAAFGAPGLQVAVATIHGFAHDLLRRYAATAGLSPAFQILDDAGATVLVRRHLPDLVATLGPIAETIALDYPLPVLRALLEIVRRARDNLLDAAQFERDIQSHTEPTDRMRLAAGFYSWYARLCEAWSMVDYGELLVRAGALLRADPGIRAEITAAHAWLLVDEYQDINLACAELITCLVPASGLWAVGDPLQAIYRWRGADPAALHDRDGAGSSSGAFPAQLDLAVNYRSRGPIVRLCGAVAAAMNGEPAGAGRARWVAARGSDGVQGPVITVAEAEDAEAEIDGIAREIRDEVARGRPLSSHAVLCATNAQVDTLARGLALRGLPSNRDGAVEDEPVVRRALCILAIAAGETDALIGLGGSGTQPGAESVAGKDDDANDPVGLSAGILCDASRAARETGTGVPAVLRAAAPHLAGDQREAALRLAACIAAVAALGGSANRAGGSAWDSLAYYLFDSPYRAAAEALPRPSECRALHALLVAARAYDALPVELREPSLPAHLRLLLAAGIGPRTGPLEGGTDVRILTVHAAKGLEFPVVFIPNFARGRFPARGAGTTADPDDDADGGRELDNRSLLFVALSRAMDRLIISRARAYGGRQAQVSPLAALLDEAFALEPPERVTWLASNGTFTAAQSNGAVLAVPGTARGGPVSDAAANGPEVDNYALETYLDCPRRFYYQYRLHLDGAPGHGFPHFHMALRRALAATSGTNIEHIALAALDREWAVAHEPHPHETLYYQRARRTILAHVSANTTRQRPFSTSRYDHTYVLTLPSGRVLVRIDRVDGLGERMPVAIRLRSGRPSPEHRRETRVALYHAALQSEFGSGAVHQEYVLTGTVDTARAQPATYQRRLDACDRALAGIVAGAFAPVRGSHCLTCRYWLVCPNG